MELQLAGLKFDQDAKAMLDLKATLDLDNDMPLIQKRLVEMMMTLPRTTLKEEFRRRNAAINAVASYCKFQEEGATAARSQRKQPTARMSSVPAQDAFPQLAAAAAEKQALSAAMLSLFADKRPTICFLCLGKQSLRFKKRVKAFASSGDLTKHFKRKHLFNIREEDRIGCKVCQMSLQHKQHLQNHAESIHGTVS